MFSVIDRLDFVHVQKVGQLACIDPVTLTAILQQGNLPRITHHQFRDIRLQQIVQPSSPGAFFKREVHISTQPVDELQKDAR